MLRYDFGPGTPYEEVQILPGRRASTPPLSGMSGYGHMIWSDLEIPLLPSFIAMIAPAQASMIPSRSDTI